MVAVQRTSVKPLRDQRVSCQRILDRHDRSIPVEPTEGEMADPWVRLGRGLDDQPIEGLEGDTLPPQIRGGPAGHAVEVGGDLPPGERREKCLEPRQIDPEVSRQLVEHRPEPATERGRA